MIKTQLSLESHRYLLPCKAGRQGWRRGQRRAGQDWNSVGNRQRGSRGFTAIRRRVDINLDDFHVPEDPVLRGGPVRNIVRDGVSPGRQAPIGAEEVAVASLELDAASVLDGLPLDGGVEPLRERLEDLVARHAQQEELVGSCEVLAVTALQANYVVVFGHVFDHPPRALRGPLAGLRDRLFVLLRQQVLVVVAAETHRLRAVEEVHASTELVRTYCLHE